MTIHWADLSTLKLPEHLLPSYSLALADAIKSKKLTGFCGEQITVGGSAVTSCVVLSDQAFETWNATTRKMFEELTLPGVATVAALNALPHFTPALLLYIQRKQSSPRKPAAETAAPGEHESPRRQRTRGSTENVAPDQTPDTSTEPSLAAS